jgi:prevent-host-death family protein
VGTCGHNGSMAVTGVRELKDNLSRYIRRVEAGERIAITVRGRIVAELVPRETTWPPQRSRWDALLAAGILRAPLEDGDPFEDWPNIRLSRGTVAALIDADRGEP